MKRPPSDLVRLARAFDVPPTRQGAAFAVTATLAGLGALGMAPLFIPAAAVLAGLGGTELRLRRRVAAGLRELDGWGFPVTGYRQWLLAEEPVFEIELRREVDIDVIARSAAALDSTVVVQRQDDRVFRVVTRRIALPPRKPGGSVVYLGDRRLLRELHAAVIAPLHADVGIVALRMGDLRTISALVPTRAAPDLTAPGDTMGAFREPAMAAPPALQALQRVGTLSLRPAQDARRLNLHVLTAMRGWKVFQFHDTSATASIKQKHTIGDSRTLQPDGANLAALLFGLKKCASRKYRVIVEVIRAVAPFFDDSCSNRMSWIPR